MIRKLSIIAIVVVLATATVAAFPAMTVPTFSAQNQARVHTIGTCRTIDQSGRYLLTQDIQMAGEEPCLTVAASNVTIDGNSHTIFERTTHDSSVAVGTIVANQTNITITNLTTNGPARAIDFKNVTGGRISNVTALKTSREAITIRGNNLIVSSNTLRGSGAYGIRIYGSNITVRNNTIGLTQGILTQSGDNLTIANNKFANSGIYLHHMNHVRIVGNNGGNKAYSVASSDVSNLTIANNVFNSTLYIRSVNNPNTKNITITNNILRTENTYYDVALFTVKNVEISDNTIEGSELGIDLMGHGDLVTIEHNAIQNHQIGILVESPWNVTVQNNVITNNKIGLRNQVASNCRVKSEGNRSIVIHQNVIADNSQYGVQNDAIQVLNATQNYWGASNGPSSPNVYSAPFKDPVTGTVADGRGGAISENPNVAGVSNLHFDTWLENQPMNAGIQNKTAS